MLSSPSVAAFALVAAVALIWLPDTATRRPPRRRVLLAVSKGHEAVVARLLSHPVEGSGQAVGHATADPVRTLMDAAPGVLFQLSRLAL